jgi:ketosteroid isomerase-like protein
VKKVVSSLIFLLACLAGPKESLAADASARLVELELFWSQVARTVREGEFAAYAASYHDDAVVVSLKDSVPIAQALAAWKTGFVETKAGKTRADVQFRFSKRVSDTTTAHETGIFQYSSTDTSGKARESFVHFEALLVKKGSWKIIMENQKNAASKAEWDAIK